MAEENEIGNWFQKVFYEKLCELRDFSGAYIHQFVDTRQARNFVAEQPSDFQVQKEGRSAEWLEVKASSRHKSLKNCTGMIRSSQLLEARQILKNGGNYTFWFYSEPLNKIEVWEGGHVCDCLKSTSKSKLETPIKTFDYADLGVALQEHFR